MNAVVAASRGHQCKREHATLLRGYMRKASGSQRDPVDNE